MCIRDSNGTAGIRQNEALQEEGVIGLANTLVKVEEIYRGLADHLLGRTVVVKHIDHGVALAKKYKQTLRIVTLEGELINPGGAMTGGAFRLSLIHIYKAWNKISIRIFRNGSTGLRYGSKRNIYLW